MADRYLFKSRPRKRLLTMQPGWLKVCWGRLEGDSPDIVYIRGDGVGRHYGHLMHSLMGPFLKFLPDPGDALKADSMGRLDWAATLDAAGFDLSTLEIRIKLRSENEERNP